jgi:hypothetical protein
MPTIVDESCPFISHFLKFEARCAYKCADPKRNCYLRRRAREEREKVRAKLAKKKATRRTRKKNALYDRSRP